MFSRQKVSKVNKSFRKLARSCEWILDDGIPFLQRNDGKSNSSIMQSDGKNSFRLKRHWIRNSTRQQKFSKPPIPSSIFYSRFKKIFDTFEINVDRCVVSRGCWETNKHTLQQQLIPQKQGDFLNYDFDCVAKFDVAARNVIRKLKIPVLPKCDKRSILYTSYNPETYPGFRYGEYLYKNKKKDAILPAFINASKRWDVIEKGEFSRNDIIPSLYSIGARNKRDFTYEDGEVATSRVVHMPEFHVELTSGPWTDNITETLKANQKGPIFIGNNSIRFERLSEAFENCEEVIEGDWKQFDSTIYISIIICACAILRLYYDLEDPKIDRHFIAMFDSIAIKDYYTPGGYIFRAIHGIPSGVKSTNLLGSIVNLLALNYCTDAGSNRRFVYVTGGDDFCIGCRDKQNEEFKTSLEAKAAELGMQFKFIKFKTTKTKDLESIPCFYKYIVFDNSPRIPPSAMLERVFMPWNKNYDDPPDLMKFLQDVMPSLGKPGSNLIMYYLFYQYVYLKLTGRILTLAAIVKIHENVYSRMMLRGGTFIKDRQGEVSIPFKDLDLKDFEQNKSIRNLTAFCEI